MADNPRDGDVERLEKLRRVHSHRWGVDPTDEPVLFFLRRLLDARDAALREAHAEIARLRAVVEAARKCRKQLAYELECTAGAAATIAEMPGYDEVGISIEEHREQIESVILEIDTALAPIEGDPARQGAEE